MVYGFDYRCALAKMLPEVLDTEGCISCSRKLRSRHGCLDQGFDPFEGNGTTRHLGKLWWWCHFFHVVIWAEFYSNANEVSSPDLSKPKMKSTQMTCFVYANHSGCCKVTCWSDWNWNISLLILLKSSLYELLNVIGMSWQFVENWGEWILVSTKICYYFCWLRLPDDLFLFTYTNHFGIVNITWSDWKWDYHCWRCTRAYYIS